MGVDHMFIISWVVYSINNSKMTQRSSMIFTPNNYSFCNLTMSLSKIITIIIMIIIQ